MQDFLTLIETIIGIVLVVVILMQVRGQGAGVFGSAETIRAEEMGSTRIIVAMRCVRCVMRVEWDECGSWWDERGLGEESCQ